MKQSKYKKKTKVTLERMLLQQIPETPVPEPYFNIPSPQPYSFPLSSTLLEGIKLVESYYPEDINEKINKRLNGRTIERMSRFKDVYCMMGKNGNGLLIGNTMMDVKGVTAFAYGPTFLAIAYEDLRLEIYSMQLKLIKNLKGFSTKKINFIKIVTVPRNYESIILITNCGSKLYSHRVQKSLFSTLSVKLTKQITSLQFPVTQISEIPAMFKLYLRHDSSYKDTTLLCISAINTIYILRINLTKLNLDHFWDIVYSKRIEKAFTSWVSWGEAFISCPTRDIKGEKLICTCSFDNQVYLIAFREAEMEHTKPLWLQSYPFKLNDKRVAFCQLIKKNQLMIINEVNSIIVLHTRNFDIFEKEIKEGQVEMLSEAYTESHLEFRHVNIPPRKADKNLWQSTQQDMNLIHASRMLTYADTFLYEFPSNEIYFLTKKGFEVYVYCNWKLIADLLKVEQKYQCAMNFLIAMHKKANKFDLQIEGNEKELSEYIQMLTIDYINKKLIKIKQIPEMISTLTKNQEYFKMVVTPLQFLVETFEFDFLFEVAKDKIVGCLVYDNSDKCYKQCQEVFFTALSKFIEFGRIKYIPETKMQQILNYYVVKEQLEMVDMLAIYFDLEKIDRNIVIQCLLQNNLVVSLAHICTQGNQSQFVTPFVKFWGISENFKRLGKEEYAYTYTFRALWYVKLCLQRNWILKEYSFDKYSRMITILSQHFLSEKILVGLIELRPIDCLECLSYYFTIENAQIINDSEIKISYNQIETWIQRKQGNQKLEKLLSSIAHFTRKALKSAQIAKPRLQLFLSTIIIYKTVTFTNDQYFQILKSLIQNYQTIKEIKYGLQEKMLSQYLQQFSNFQEDDLTEILSARYINKILTLVYYHCQDYVSSKLLSLYEESRQFNLTELQAEISFLQRNFNNCIQIYVRAKGASQILLFEFLENSFKRLILERRRQDKNILTATIKRYIKYMVQKEPRKTKKIIQNYIPEIQEELIAALADSEELQLEYLEGIANDEERTIMKNQLSQESILRFVYLMAKHKPDYLIDVLKKNNNFCTEEAIKICQQYEVYDCMEYLYERMGNIIESVAIAALRIDQILKMRESDNEEENLAPYIKIKEILDNSIDICKNNHSEQIWQALLDSFINLYNKYKDSNLPDDQVEIFFFINGEIMENLASNCSIQHTIDLLQTKYNNLNMGGKMTKAFINILSDLSHSINILYIASNLVQISLQSVLQVSYIQKLHPFHTPQTCETCHYSILKRKQSIHFRCGHCYHKECLITQQPPICISCLGDKSDQFTYYLNTLNPRFPRIKKVNDLLENNEKKRFQMSEIFKIEEYQKTEQKEDNVLLAKHQKKKGKFEKFDELVYDVEAGNRRVLTELSVYQ